MWGPISGSGGLTAGYTATGDTVHLAGALSYMGATTVAIGTLRIGNGLTDASGAIPTSSISLGSGTSLIVDVPPGLSASYTNSLSGSGGLTVMDAGTLTISSTNTSGFTGTVSANGGTLSLTGSLNSSTPLALGGGTFSYAPTANSGTGNTQTLASLTINSGASTIDVTTGNTLAITSSTITRSTGGTVNFNPSGSGQITTTNTTGDGTGIIGPWAFYGGSTNTMYAAPPATAGGAVSEYYPGATTPPRR